MAQNKNVDSAPETCNNADDVIAQTMTMKRELGILEGISFIIGGIVGSGIFVSPKGVLESTGSVGLSLTVWVGAGLISLMGGLCYCELGTMIPKSGGDYTYIRLAFGNLPAFLYTWVSMVIIKPSSLSVLTLTFATYLSSLFNYCGDLKLLNRLIAITCLLTILLIIVYSTRLSANVMIVTTAAKVLTLAVIICGGVYRIASGHNSELQTGFSGSTTQPITIALAFYNALWAYDGWNQLNIVTEELKNPSKNLPRAIVIGVCSVVVIYVLTNIAYFTAMTRDELLAADAVAVVWGDVVLYPAAIIIPLAVVISTFGSSNGSAFTGGRSMFAAARDGIFPEIFSFIHVTRRTPLPSTVLLIFLAIVFVLLGNISSLINFISFSVWIFYGMTFCSLIYFRFKWKNTPRVYKVPIVFPVIMVVISIYLVIAPIIQNPSIEFLYAIAFIAAGFIFYIPFIFFKLRMPYYDKVTVFLQLLWQLVPATKYVD